MVRAERIVDIDENTDVVALAEDVQTSGETAVLQHDGKPVAKLVPVEAKPRKRSRQPKGKPMSIDDPLWKLVGIASDDGGPTDVSSNIHKYVADAIYQDKFGHRDEKP
jgi:antitoxin (DNA-binding transcriptional repressor) of toxin-antitoxin stability system